MKRNYQFFNNSNTELPFMDKLHQRLSRAWGSLGNIAVKINEPVAGNYEIMFFPAVREVMGGPTDGETFFPGFSLNIGKFVRVFDTAPKVMLDCLQNGTIDHLLFSGKIDGYNVKVVVLTGPPPGQLPVEKVYVNGPKLGVVEAV